jgi:hypothetical protein
MRKRVQVMIIQVGSAEKRLMRRLERSWDAA